MQLQGARVQNSAYGLLEPTLTPISTPSRFRIEDEICRFCRSMWWFVACRSCQFDCQQRRRDRASYAAVLQISLGKEGPRYTDDGESPYGFLASGCQAKEDGTDLE